MGVPNIVTRRRETCAACPRQNDRFIAAIARKIAVNHFVQTARGETCSGELETAQTAPCESVTERKDSVTSWSTAHHSLAILPAEPQYTGARCISPPSTSLLFSS
jgi:hypothetical protein